jgi:hypothetical protein
MALAFVVAAGNRSVPPDGEALAKFLGGMTIFERAEIVTSSWI